MSLQIDNNNNKGSGLTSLHQISFSVMTQNSQNHRIVIGEIRSSLKVIKIFNLPLAMSLKLNPHGTFLLGGYLGTRNETIPQTTKITRCKYLLNKTVYVPICLLNI